MDFPLRLFSKKQAIASMASIAGRVGIAAMLGSSQAFAVNWEQQAERLARVSATLLDGIPVLEPATSKYGLGLKFDTSLLPKPNPKVGSKKENVPSSPVHAVPTLKGYGLFDINEKLKAGFHLYAGYLVPGLEGLMGVKAKLSQLAYGGGGTFHMVLSPLFALTADAGLHMTSGKATGAITEPDAKDEFTFNTMAYYLAPGMYMPTTGIWGNVMLGMKNTKAELQITKTKNKIATTDTLDDAPVPVWFQIAAGWKHVPTGMSAGLAYMVVPERLYMPRLQLAAVYPLDSFLSGGTNATPPPPASRARPGVRRTTPARPGQRNNRGVNPSRGAPGARGGQTTTPPPQEIAP